jgi:hypothetical protein
MLSRNCAIGFSKESPPSATRLSAVIGVDWLRGAFDCFVGGAGKESMNQSQPEAHAIEGGSHRSWVLALSSLLFVLLQSACTAVMAISGLRFLIGVTSLAASILPGFIFTIHAERIRVPMLILAVLGSVVNLYVLWRIWSLRSRPASQWRTEPVTAKQRRSERIQFVISILTLALVITESLFHHHLHGSF